jgi:hypothetical protein
MITTVIMFLVYVPAVIDPAHGAGVDGRYTLGTGSWGEL